MDKEKFEQLARLRTQAKAIEKQIEEIYPAIQESVADLEEGTVIEGDSGTFTVSHRRTWTYTHDCIRAGEEFDKMKEEEQQKGLATYTTKPSVAFKAYK